MRVFSLTTGSDTAGIAIRLKRAFDRYAPGWDFHTMVASLNYIDYPVDIPWSQRELERQYDAADVVLIHNTLHAHRWYDMGQGKPTVLMHHGMRSLAEYLSIVAEARDAGIVQVGSTLDLSVHAPEVTWMPPPYDLAALRAIRAASYRSNDKVQVAHSPTNRAIKGTDAFLAAMATLPRAEAILIERVDWAESLRLHGMADLFFDQPVLGYGCAAIESWAMGVPVIAGVVNADVREAMLRTWGVLPFAEATEGSLRRVLATLTRSAPLRDEYADRGTQHVERWHDEAVVVARLQEQLMAAGPTVAGGSGKRLSAETIAKIERHERRLARAGR